MGSSERFLGRPLSGAQAVDTRHMGLVTFVHVFTRDCRLLEVSERGGRRKGQPKGGAGGRPHGDRARQPGLWLWRLLRLVPGLLGRQRPAAGGPRAAATCAAQQLGITCLLLTSPACCLLAVGAGRARACT